jgi:hypothetical protein
MNDKLIFKADQLTTYTKAEVNRILSDVLDSVPEALDTLNEVAQVLHDDANNASTVQNQTNSEQHKSIIGKPPASTSSVFDLNEIKFRAIHVGNPSSIQTTHDSYVTIEADCYWC